MATIDSAEWFRYHTPDGQKDDVLFDLWAKVNSLIEENADAGWKIVTQLVADAPDDEMLGMVAAGPLEDLLHAWPHEVAERVEESARRDPKFRRSLSGIYTSELPQEVKERVEKYLGPVVTEG